MHQEGLDNSGHPLIKTVDMRAGDEESCETFAAVYQSILAKKHLQGSEEAGHRTDLDASMIGREGQHASYVNHHGAGEAKPGRRSLHHGGVARGAGRGRARAHRCAATAHGSWRCASASSTASISQARRGWRCATPT